MPKRKPPAFCPEWSWWIRSGERLNLGIDLREVFPVEATTVEDKLSPGLANVAAEIHRGARIVDAFRRGGTRLPLEGWCLLEAGEHAGRLGDAMREVGSLLEEREKRRRQLAGQLWYPSLVLATGVVVMGIILFWVVPGMRETSRSMGLGEQLPWVTENIGKLYGVLFCGFFCIVIIMTILGFVLRGAARRSRYWAAFRESLMARAPLLGKARHWAREARILRQLATLLSGGTTLPASLEICATDSPDEWERGALQTLRQHLLLGAGFREALNSCPILGRETVPLLLAGQESGKLEEYMLRLADELERRSSWKVQQATRLLEPVFLLFLSTAVGMLILAYMLPMVRMLEQAGAGY